jgi:hypothetical protein
MTIEINRQQLIQLQELIFDEIDKVGGYEQLSDELEDILQQINILKNNK